MPVLLLCLLSLIGLPALAASASEEQLIRDLRRIARTSSEGTPRAINADIVDRGFTVDRRTLINHLSVRPEHAEDMRRNPGAVLRYQFTEAGTNWPVASESFIAEDCADL